MKRNVLHLLIPYIFVCASGYAQTSDHFNSRPGVSIQEVKSHLENQCWYFQDFDVNQSGWNSPIDGSGAMVSDENITGTTMGITTPLLKLENSVTISFKYKFNQGLAKGRRWIKVYLVDQNNALSTLLDSIEFKDIKPSNLGTYKKSFLQLQSGPFRVFVNFGGKGEGKTRIAVDDFYVSASLHYSSGCNRAPVANADHFKGDANRGAQGNVFSNDQEPDAETTTAYLVNQSPDGEVKLQPDGNFIFLPKAGFRGSSTTFSYSVCDAGFTPLCSEEATVTVEFPRSAMVPISLIDFAGLYMNDGKVEISWVTNFEQNSERFDVERSFDGSKWERVGSMKGHGTSTVKRSYQFIDDAGKNTANKKDLYYRLVQFDSDGRASHSRILIVRVYNTKSLKTVSVTPNPMRNDIAVSLQLNEKAYLVMKVRNHSGIEVMKKAVHASQGSSLYLFNGTSSLKPGMYFLEILINTNERMVVKLLKE